MLPLIPIALGIAQAAAPWLVSRVLGDEAGLVASRVVQAAQGTTGAASPDEALAAVRATPETAARVQEALARLEADLAREDTARLQAINETARTESRSEDPYVRRWRPTWGYVTAATWAVQGVGVLAALVGAVVATLEGKTAAVTALLTGASELAGALTLQWGVALAVLGVAVQQRTRDKEAAQGSPPPTMWEVVGGVLTRKGGKG
ncbi:3TM-type holin [Pararhodospirillum photometricum]|uniref:Uncharacterized protein n=1 Tax=Pararhodospirillum photometricum DSM 122 TaxID=1150469 RepID=H6SQM7_PARPM|nr:3TM-type holin [Pararhodospirillum photometricum]CCG07342.1 Putative uncharacterized protein [Pararhodospirillum photometricum DSM 122]